jgi:hypothetical protein
MKGVDRASLMWGSNRLLVSGGRLRDFGRTLGRDLIVIEMDDASFLGGARATGHT